MIYWRFFTIFQICFYLVLSGLHPPPLLEWDKQAESSLTHYINHFDKSDLLFDHCLDQWFTTLAVH